jgi:hypothetical protein
MVLGMTWRLGSPFDRQALYILSTGQRGNYRTFHNSTGERIAMQIIASIGLAERDLLQHSVGNPLATCAYPFSREAYMWMGRTYFLVSIAKAGG